MQNEDYRTSIESQNTLLAGCIATLSIRHSGPQQGMNLCKKIVMPKTAIQYIRSIWTQKITRETVEVEGGLKRMHKKIL